MTPRKSSRFDRLDAALLAVYACVLFWAVRQHLDWADEAQAWLIARNSSLHQLLFRRLHYEGAPALWPLLLWSLAHLHLPYASIHWLAAACALAGVYLLLRSSPFPRTIRALLPLTFFLQYQYAVIARPYVLFPALIFGLCIVYSRPRPSPVLFAAIAGLVANVSVHGAIFACAIFVLYWYDRGPAWQSISRPERRGWLHATGIFVLLAAMAAAVAFPAPDVAFAVKSSTSTGKLHAVLLRLMPEERLPAAAPPLDPPLIDPAAAAAKPASGGTASRLLVPILANAVRAVDAACYPIARSNWLAVSFLACWAAWLWSRDRLHLALPWALSILLSVEIWVYDHHTGLFLLAILASTWIALAGSTHTRGPRWIGPLFGAVAMVVILLQIGWTAHCIRAESAHPYDPGLATERYLAANYAGKRIAGFAYESVSAQAYAPHSLFFNQDHSFWVWSDNTLIDRRRTEALAQRPDVVVVGDFVTGQEMLLNQWGVFWPPGRHPYAGMLGFWQAHGYRMTRQFCGDRIIRLGVTNTFCEDILVPSVTARN